MRGETGRFRCDECKRVLSLEDDGGEDCGGSHWFCFRCLERLENRAATIEARAERKHGVLLSSTVIFQLAWGQSPQNDDRTDGRNSGAIT